MLTLDADLPEGALCRATPGALGAGLGAALWWHGDADCLDLDPETGAVTRWRALADGPAALPTAPNRGHARAGTREGPTGAGQTGAGQMGVQCRPGLHCGLVAEGAVPDAATATVALRFAVPPGAEARTLLTLNTERGAEGAGRYLFLSETAGLLTAKDDAGLVEATLPCPPQVRPASPPASPPASRPLPRTGALSGPAPDPAPDPVPGPAPLPVPRLLVASLAGDRLAVDLDGVRAEARAPAPGPVLSGPASLYFGCRNQRPRLLKTLGGALLLDVWLFPGRALLLSPAPGDRAALAALRRHHLWAGA